MKIKKGLKNIAIEEGYDNIYALLYDYDLIKGVVVGRKYKKRDFIKLLMKHRKKFLLV